MAMRRSLHALLLALCMPGLPAAAGETGTTDPAPHHSAAEALALFSAYGYHAVPDATVTVSNCRPKFDLAQQTFLDKVPDLQKLGIMNEDLTATQIAGEPNTLSLAFVVEALPVAIEATYDDHPGIDRCQFSQYLTIVDDYGHDERLLAASFGFDRATFERIDWSKFQASKLTKVAKGFRFSPELMSRVSSERQ